MCNRMWLVVGMAVVLGTACVAEESFVIAPVSAKKKTASRAVLANELESHVKDLIASFNMVIQDAAYFEGHYLSAAYALDDNTQAAELSSFIDEIKRVQHEVDGMMNSMHIIKKNVVASQKTTVQPPSSQVKKAP